MSLPPLLARVVADPDAALAPLGDGPARVNTELAVRSFLAGVALYGDGGHADLLARLATLELRPRAFAWEGVGLAAWSRGPARFLALEALSSTPSVLMAVGAGWASALAGREPPAMAMPEQVRDALEDGHGFCRALLRRRFDTSTAAGDRGIGRALYFLHGGRPAAIARMVASLDRRRAEGVWRGIGVASIFVGTEVDRAELASIGGAALVEGQALAQQLLASV